MKRKIVSFIIACIIVSSFLGWKSITAHAVVEGGYQRNNGTAIVNNPVVFTAPDTSSEGMNAIYQGNSIGDFLAKSQVSQITIDEDKINDMRTHVQGTLLFDSSKPEYSGLGFVNMFDAIEYPDPKASGKSIFENHLKSEQLGSSFFAYDQQVAVQAGYGLKVNSDNVFSGDLVEYRFNGAATLEDGSPADVVFKYSNLHLVLEKSIKEWDHDDKWYNSLQHMILVNGNQAQIFGTHIDPNTNKLDRSNIDYHQRYGMQIDVNIRVVYPDSNDKVDGLFYFRVADLDVDRSTASTFGRLYNSDKVNNYSEQVKLMSGYDTSPYSIYLPGGVENDKLLGEGDKSVDPPNIYNGENADVSGKNYEGYKCIIKKESDGFLFQPKLTDLAYKNAGTLYSGFVAVANNSNGGVNLRLWEAGTGTNTVETYLLAGFGKRNGAIAENTLFKKVLSISETGGTIQTTTKLNTTFDLTDGQIVGPGKLSVHTGSNVGYTMTAAGPGWGIDQVWVNQLQGDNLEYPTRDTNAANVSEVTTAVKTTETQDANGNRRYKYYFNEGEGTNVSVNKSIHVTWKRVAFTEYYSNDSSIPPGVKTVLDTYLPPSETEWKPNGDSFTPKNPTTTSYTDPATGIIYTFKGWDKGTTTINQSDVYFRAIWEASDGKTYPPDLTQYPESYSYDGTLPPEVMATIPTRSNLYYNGDSVTPADPSAKTVTVGNQVYEFAGWDQQTKVVNGAGVHFVGKWTVRDTTVPPPTPVTPAPGGGGSTPPAPPAADPEDKLPDLFVPSVETSGTGTVDGASGLTITYGQATPVTITPVMPEGVTAGPFKKLQVDGVIIDPPAYAVVGDAIILQPEYLNLLAEGKHTVRLIYQNVWTEAVVTVLGVTRPSTLNAISTPQTPDRSEPLMLASAMLLMLAAICLCRLIPSRKRNR